MTLRYACLLLLLMSLAACDNSSSRFLPDECPHWALTVVAPRHMEAWVETLEVKDDHGRWMQIPQGVVGEIADTRGWSDLRYGGGGSRFLDAGAPMEVYVRWQSLAEPQTYTWRFTVPARLRQALVKREVGKVWYRSDAFKSCRSDITVGVAPGGHTIVWIDGTGLPSIEILRGKAEVEPLGPDQGKHEGRYVRISDEAKAYVQEHGIPYDSW